MFYGTTLFGGTGGGGTVFEMTAGGTESQLYSFRASSAGPYAGVLDSNGSLYGTSYSDGKYKGGIIFKLTL